MTSEIVTSSSPSDTPLDQCCSTTAPRLTSSEAAALAAQLGAVADPARLQVLSMIACADAGEVCACDFVGPIGKSQPTISHHLKVLSGAGLIDGERRGRWIWYRLAPSAFGDVVAALAAVTTDGPDGTDAT